MICPRCKVYQDILAFVPLQQIEEYAEETNWLTKCPDCHFIFSPRLENPVLTDLQGGGRA